LNKKQDYWFRIDAFNENVCTPGVPQKSGYTRYYPEELLKEKQFCVSSKYTVSPTCIKPSEMGNVLRFSRTNKFGGSEAK